MDIGLVVGALGDGIVAMRVVICGGGVIGACTAYFLSLRQVEVAVVERTGVVCAASGKSGGFHRAGLVRRIRARPARPARLQVAPKQPGCTARTAAALPMEFGHGDGHLAPPARSTRLVVAAGLVLGSLPALLGLIVVVPVLRHARWRLYRKMVAR